MASVWRPSTRQLDQPDAGAGRRRWPGAAGGADANGRWRPSWAWPDLDLSASFRELGGDSVSALALSLRLEEACGVPVPVAAILNPGSGLAALVRQLGAGRPEAPGGLPTFRAVHGAGATVLRASDLRPGTPDRPFGPRRGGGVARLRPPVRTVLLTGANGFLGHVLCLEWLERMAQAGGRVCALVRAADDQAAAARLQAAYGTGDDRLLRRFQSLAAAPGGAGRGPGRGPARAGARGLRPAGRRARPDRPHWGHG